MSTKVLCPSPPNTLPPYSLIPIVRSCSCMQAWDLGEPCCSLLSHAMIRKSPVQSRAPFTGEQWPHTLLFQGLCCSPCQMTGWQATSALTTVRIPKAVTSMVCPCETFHFKERSLMFGESQCIVQGYLGRNLRLRYLLGFSA